jgi:hypothetical protein
MNTTSRWPLAALCMLALLVAGCGPTARAQETAPNETPSRVEPIAGTELSRVILTDEAARRIDLQTQQVRTQNIEGVERLVIPYAAVIYDTEGTAWAYTNPQPLTFVRHAVEIESIEGDAAILSDGPPAGTQVVVVGTPELYGAEFEFQEG